MTLVQYLLRYLGYALTGTVHEHALGVWYGAQGGNGKSTLLGLMGSILGDYHEVIAPEVLLQSTGQHPTGLMGLRGRRLVTSVEAPEGRRWNESLIKQLTGGDAVRARAMRQDFVTFQPTWKIVLGTNARPLVREPGRSFWRRMHLVPWERSFEGREDRHLPDKLAAEAEGVLRWLVYACGLWQQQGLVPPSTVREATEEYRESQDVLGAFLAECLAAEADGWISRAELYSVYSRWCDTGKEHALSRIAFGRVMHERGWRIQVRNGHRGFKGWKVLQTW